MRKIRCPECHSIVNDNLESCSMCGFPFPFNKESLYVTVDDQSKVQEDGVKDKDVYGQSEPVSETAMVSEADQGTSNREGSTYAEPVQVQVVHKGALVRCPECGADAYSEDEICENCGFQVGKYFAKQNKETLSDKIDNFSIDGVKEYIDYVISDARNTIKIMAIGIVVDCLAMLVSLCMGISKINMLVNLMQQYSLNKASYAAGNADAASMEIQYRGIFMKQGISIAVTVVLFILFIIGFVVMYKNLKKDYEG